MSRMIALGGGHSDKYTIVDEDDYEEVIGHGWCYSGGYALARMNKKTVMLHRFILELSNEDGKVDHINHNGLDNRKCNLRVVSNSHNASNRAPYSSKSKYKGVRPRNKKWEAFITHNKKQRYLGVFSTEEDAARAYDYHASTLFGEFAYLNFRGNSNENR